MNCTIFVAAVRRICTMTNCESVGLTVAAGTPRVGNCWDCTVYSYSHCGAPIVYGDTRNLLMGPHNAGYADLPNQLQSAGLNIQVSDLHLRI